MISSWNGSRSSVTSEPLMRSVDCVETSTGMVWWKARKNTLHAWRRVVLLSSIYVPPDPLCVKKWGGGYDPQLLWVRRPCVAYVLLVQDCCCQCSGVSCVQVRQLPLRLLSTKQVSARANWSRWVNDSWDTCKSLLLHRVAGTSFRISDRHPVA